MLVGDVGESNVWHGGVGGILAGSGHGWDEFMKRLGLERMVLDQTFHRWCFVTTACKVCGEDALMYARLPAILSEKISFRTSR